MGKTSLGGFRGSCEGIVAGRDTDRQGAQWGSWGTGIVLFLDLNNGHMDLFSW